MGKEVFMPTIPILVYTNNSSGSLALDKFNNTIKVIPSNIYLHILI
jgi:hypothetical protein